MRLAMTTAAVAALLVPAIAAARVPDGIWQNPKGTVRVQFRACGPAICGRVVWASPDAQAQVRDAGGGSLVGTDLFTDFTATGANQWEGSVFVPDIGRSISGTITQTGPRTLVGEGCLLGAFGCRQQTWVRVK